MQKIHNLFELDYPPDGLEVIIVDDGSSDETCELVRQTQQEFPDRSLQLIEMEHPGGKPVALDRGVSSSAGEFLLFCDARQMIEPGALRELVAVFADPTVGAASGELRFPSKKGPGLYWRYERAIRKAEGRINSVIGVTGALYLIRRSLYRSFPPGIILDDVWLPMQIASQGLRVLHIDSAVVFDRESELQREFQRKTRTLAGNFQLMAVMPSLLSPWSNRLFWPFLSHKVMRLLCPYFLLSLYLSSFCLAFSAPSLAWFWWLALAGQSGFYLLALWEKWGLFSLGRVSKFAHTFVVLNWAAVVGFKRFLLGDFRWTR